MLRNPDCELCPLHQSARTVCMDGRGPRNARLMIIGEAPGKVEDETGKPFVGQAGTLLATLLQKAGIDPSTARITNICRCRPPSNRAPTRNEIKACRPYLETEIQTVNPEFILLLGNTALSHIKKTGITSQRGQPFQIDGRTYFATFHPAAALRDPGRQPAIEQDLNKLATLLKGEKLPTENDVKWRVITSENREEFVSRFEQSKWFVFDLETTGLKYYLPEESINCIGFCLEDESCWVLPSTEPFARDLIYRLSKLGKKAIAHNGKFDNSWLMSKYGFKFNLRFDTCLAHHLLDENEPDGLKYLARVYLNAPDYDISKKDKLGGDLERLYRYCALDCYYTFKLFHLFRNKLLKLPALRRLFNNLVMPVARLYEEIEQYGHYIDQDKFIKTEKELSEKHSRLEKELQAMSGSRRKINWNSPDQVGELLFKRMKLPVMALTPTGKYATGEEVLKEIEEPIVKKLLEYRGVQKMLSTYIHGWIPLMHDGMVFMDTKINGTVTGRFSSRLHQVPRDGTIRNVITAPEGWEFVAADYSQIELRIIAEVADEPRMKMVFQTNGDIHAMTAQQVMGITGEPTKEQRRGAKAVNFGLVYGMWAKKFRIYAKNEYDVDFSMGEAQRYCERYFQVYNRVPKYHERQRRIVRTQGYVTNLVGRIRRLPGVYSPEPEVQSEAERQAINSPIQGFGSGDLKVLGMLAVREVCDRDKVIIKGEVHDSCLFWVRKDCLEEELPKIRDAMENPPDLKKVFGVTLTVPVKVDIEVGPWGMGKKWE